MEQAVFAGALLRMLRLEKNWSQETLCRGICNVSYLSKIEKGRAEPNTELLKDLFAKLGVSWDNSSESFSQIQKDCEEAYEAVFSGNQKAQALCADRLQEYGLKVGPYYLDLITLNAYFHNDSSLIPQQMLTVLNARQSCLVHILQNAGEEAFRCCSCALTAMILGIQTYTDGDYTLALEHLQKAYDLACQEGYAYLMMNCQIFIANCYSDLQNIKAMETHCKIAHRLAQAVDDPEMIRHIRYNIVCTKMECGDFSTGYTYFTELKAPSVLELHKLAICCEKLKKNAEAVAALNAAENAADGLEAQMCRLVRYRLEYADYLHDNAYGNLLLETFQTLRKDRPVGFARFHLPWVEEWCTANRQYRLAYEIIKNFP